MKSISIATLLLTLLSCSVKDVSPTIHEEAIVKDQENLIYRQNEAQKLTLGGEAIDESRLSDLAKMVDRNDRNSLIDFVETASHELTTEKIAIHRNYVIYRNLFSLYNRALLNLTVKKDRRSQSVLAQVEKKYFETLFDGCDQNYRGCKNYSFFARDYNTAHLLLAKASGISHIADYYKYMEFAYGIQNKIADVEYALNYGKRAQEYATYLEKNDLNERLATHKRIYQESLRMMEKKSNDDRVIEFVRGYLSKIKENVVSSFDYEQPMMLSVAQKISKDREDLRDGFFQLIFTVPATFDRSDLKDLYDHDLAYTSIFHQLYMQQIDVDKAYVMWKLAGGEKLHAIKVAKAYLDLEYHAVAKEVNRILSSFYNIKKDVITPMTLAQEMVGYSAGVAAPKLDIFGERFDLLVSFLKKIEPELATHEIYKEIFTHFESYKFNAAIDMQLAQALVLNYYAIKEKAILLTFDANMNAKLGSPETSLRNIMESINIEMSHIRLSSFASKGAPNYHDILHSYKRVIQNGLLDELTKIDPGFNNEDFTYTILDTMLRPLRERYSKLEAKLKTINSNSAFRQGMRSCQEGFSNVQFEVPLDKLSWDVYYSRYGEFFKKQEEYFMAFQDNEGAMYAGAEDRLTDYRTVNKGYRLGDSAIVIGQMNAIADLYREVTGDGYNSKALEPLRVYNKARKDALGMVNEMNGPLLECTAKWYKKEKRVQKEVLLELRKIFADAFDQITSGGDLLSQADDALKGLIRDVVNVPNLHVVDNMSENGIQITPFGAVALVGHILKKVAPEVQMSVSANIENTDLYMKGSDVKTVSASSDKKDFINNAMEAIVSGYYHWTKSNSFDYLDEAIRIEINKAMFTYDYKIRDQNYYRSSLEIMLAGIDHMMELVTLDDEERELMEQLKIQTRITETSMAPFIFSSTTNSSEPPYSLLFLTTFNGLSTGQDMARMVYRSYFERPVVFANGQGHYDEVQPYFATIIHNRTALLEELLEMVSAKERADYTSSIDDASIAYQMSQDMERVEKSIPIKVHHDEQRVEYIKPSLITGYRNSSNEFHKETKELFLK